MEIDLTGVWKVEFRYKDESKGSELKLVQSGRNVMGIDEGGGCAYHVDGEIKGNHFGERYMALASTAQNDSSDGELSLEIKNNGNLLDGHYTYYEGGKEIKYKYKATKIMELT